MDVNNKPGMELQRMQAEVTALRAQLQALRSDFDGLTISGAGFSGSGRSIQWSNPTTTINVTATCNNDGTISITASTA